MMGGFGNGLCRGLGGFGGGMGILGGLIGLLFFAGLIAVAVLIGVSLMRHLGGDRARFRAHGAGMLSPRDLAAQRYARGEITREQYLQILADLAGGTGVSSQ
jgi:uncharacterized membrane protein